MVVPVTSAIEAPAPKNVAAEDNNVLNATDSLPKRDPASLYTLDLAKNDTLAERLALAAQVLTRQVKFDPTQFQKNEQALDKTNHPEKYEATQAEEVAMGDDKKKKKKEKTEGGGVLLGKIAKATGADKALDQLKKQAPAILGKVAHVPPLATKAILNGRSMNVLHPTGNKGVAEGSIELTEQDVKAVLDSVKEAVIGNSNVYQGDVVFLNQGGITFVTNVKYTNGKPEVSTVAFKNISVDPDGAFNTRGVEDPNQGPLKKGETPHLLKPQAFFPVSDAILNSSGDDQKTLKQQTISEALGLISEYNAKVRNKSHASVLNADEQNVAQLTPKQWETLITQTGTDYTFLAGKESASGIADWNIIDGSGVSVGSAKRVADDKIEVSSNARWGLGEAIEAATEKAPVASGFSKEDKALLTGPALSKAALEKKGNSFKPD